MKKILVCCTTYNVDASLVLVAFLITELLKGKLPVASFHVLRKSHHALHENHWSGNFGINYER